MFASLDDYSSTHDVEQLSCSVVMAIPVVKVSEHAYIVYRSVFVDYSM